MNSQDRNTSASDAESFLALGIQRYSLEPSYRGWGCGHPSCLNPARFPLPKKPFQTLSGQSSLLNSGELRTQVPLSLSLPFLASSCHEDPCVQPSSPHLFHVSCQGRSGGGRGPVRSPLWPPHFLVDREMSEAPLVSPYPTYLSTANP